MGAEMSTGVVTLDSAKLRALAHPLRSRLLAELRLSGPATATALAKRLDTNSGATSYHLRELADVGLVEEVPERGTGRQRWWQAAHDYTSWVETDFDEDPDDRAAVDWLLGHHIRTTTRWVEDWAEARREWPVGWRASADHSDYQLELSAEGLRALRDELHEVIQRHVDASPPLASRPSPDPSTAAEGNDTERVVVILHAFPFVKR